MDEEEPYQEKEIKCDNTHVNLEDDEGEMQLTRIVMHCSIIMWVL